MTKTADTSPEREREIRAFASGKWPDGSPKIPAGVSSFTRDLLAMLDDARQVADDLRTDFDADGRRL